MAPDAALEAAQELFDLMPDAPSAEDPVRDREVAEARKTWAKLRAYFACHPSAARR
jgi:hypothetical protein